MLGAIEPRGQGVDAGRPARDPLRARPSSSRGCWTVTGPDGVFDIVNVGADDLDIAVAIDDEDWFVASDTACCEGAGATRLDLGTIEVR